MKSCPTFGTYTHEKQVHQSIPHLLESIKITKVVAKSALTASDLINAVDIPALEKASEDKARMHLAKGLAELADRAKVETSVLSQGRISTFNLRTYSAEVLVLNDIQQVRDALEQAFKNGVTYARRQISAVTDELASRY